MSSGSTHQGEEQLFEVGLSIEIAELVECPTRDDLPLRHDRDPIAQLLHLAHDVRGEEDRLAALAQEFNVIEHRSLDEDVEPRLRALIDG